MFEVTVELTFSAAHQIRGHPGPCARLHGHNYRAAVTITGEALNEHGMLIDFAELKELCREVISPLDHALLNELPPFASTSPTAEALAGHIHGQVAARLSALRYDLRVARVTVHESESSRATYSE